MKTIRIGATLSAMMSICLFQNVLAGQPLETESARLVKARTFEFENTFEYQTSSEGHETAFPMLFEYGLSNRLELAIEPIIYSKILPRTGPKAGGAGDLEATLTFLISPEKGRFPAFAIAAEIKAPTAKNRLIGTGKTDYAGYIIASRKLGDVDVHANLGYSILGKPAGLSLNNIFSFASAVEWHITPRWDLVGEAFANTTAAPGLGENSSVTNPNVQTAELAGGEAFAMIGARWRLNTKILLAIGIAYDNNTALLLRPGITIKL